MKKKSMRKIDKYKKLLEDLNNKILIYIKYMN